jgi:hypothetical protein
MECADGQYRTIRMQYLDPNDTAAIDKAKKKRMSLLNLNLRTIQSEARRRRDFQNSHGPDYRSYEEDVAHAAFSVLGGLSVNFVRPSPKFYYIRSVVLKVLAKLIFSQSHDNTVRLAENFLIASFVSYQTEHACSWAVRSPGSYQGYFPTYHTYAVRSSTLRQHLQSYLSVFQERCSRRGQITPPQFATTFYSLCILSTALSTLMKALSHYFEGNPKLATHLSSHRSQLRAIYISLVRTFCWAQGQSDLLGERWDADRNGSLRMMLREIRIMSGRNKWEVQGIKSTKTFLENLISPHGSGCEKLRLFFVRKCIYFADSKWFDSEELRASFLGITSVPTIANNNMEYQCYLASQEAAISPQTTNTESSTLSSTLAESMVEEGLLESKVEERQVYERQVHETLSVIDSLMEGRLSVGECEERLSELEIKKNPLSGWGSRTMIPTQVLEA